MKTYFQFIRIGMMPLTMSVPLLGYWSHLQGSGNFLSCILLAVTGMSAHIFGFGLNDLVDYEVDKNVAYRQDDALVQGKLSFTAARWITWIQCPLMFVFYNLATRPYFLWEGNFLLLSSIFTSILYNLYSKKGWMRRWIAETALAFSIGLLMLSAAYSYGLGLSANAWIFTAGFSLVLLSLNSVGSGLKDLKTDLQSGVRSFVIEQGARMLGQEQIFLPVKLKVYTYFLQGCIFTVMVIFSLVNHLLSPWLIFSGFLVLLGFAHIYYLFTKKTFVSLAGSGPLLYGYMNYIALSLLLYRSLPLIGIILLMLLGVQITISYFRYKYASL